MMTAYIYIEHLYWTEIKETTMRSLLLGSSSGSRQMNSRHWWKSKNAKNDPNQHGKKSMFPLQNKSTLQKLFLSSQRLVTQWKWVPLSGPPPPHLRATALELKAQVPEVSNPPSSPPMMLFSLRFLSGNIKWGQLCRGGRVWIGSGRCVAVPTRPPGTVSTSNTLTERELLFQVTLRPKPAHLDKHPELGGAGGLDGGSGAGDAAPGRQWPGPGASCLARPGPTWATATARRRCSSPRKCNAKRNIHIRWNFITPPPRTKHTITEAQYRKRTVTVQRNVQRITHLVQPVHMGTW